MDYYADYVNQWKVFLDGVALNEDVVSDRDVSSDSNCWVIFRDNAWPFSGQNKYSSGYVTNIIYSKGIKY